MKSAYVQRVSINVASGNKTTKVRILDIASGSRCRLFQVRFMPASFGGTIDNDGAGMDVFSGSSGPRVYGCFSEPDRYATSGSYNHINGLIFLDIPPSGILVNDDVYVQGVGLGINYASITYQVG